MAGTNPLTRSNYRRWRKIRLKVLARDNYTCGYCGELDVNTVDHITARVHGGLDYMDNLIACCNRCNLAKGSRKTVFLGSLDTPLVPSARLHTKTTTTVPVGPFAGQPGTIGAVS